jgi:hypothetical protein
MSEDIKVVNFPKAKAPRAPKPDKERVDAVRKAWRALLRVIAEAENSGLRVERDFNMNAELKITRTFK